MNQKMNIFDQVKASLNKNSKNPCELMNGVSGRFDQEMDCYAFYKQNENKTVESIVYVTRRFFENHEDVRLLEKLVLDYLDEKKGMQITLKTSGVDELPLIKPVDK